MCPSAVLVLMDILVLELLLVQVFEGSSDYDLPSAGTTADLEGCS